MATQLYLNYVLYMLLPIADKQMTKHLPFTLIKERFFWRKILPKFLSEKKKT